MYRDVLPDTVRELVQVLRAGGLRYAPHVFPRDALTRLFPIAMQSQEKVIEEMIPKDRNDWPDWFVTLAFEHMLADVLIACSYFEAGELSRLSLVVTEYVRECFIKADGRCVDFSCSPEVSALCELVFVDHGIKLFGDADYIQSWALFDGITLDDSPRCSLQHEFIRSHLLKKLVELGVLDLPRIKEFLYPPTPKLFRAAFDSVCLANNILWPASSIRHTDPTKLVKGAEFYLAQIIQLSRKRSSEIPHKALLSYVAKSGLISQELLELARRGLHRRKQEWEPLDVEHMGTCIPEIVTFLYSIKDTIQLRSLVRIKTALTALDVQLSESQEVAQPTRLNQIVRDRVSRELWDSDLSENEGLPFGTLYLDHDALFILGHQDLPRSRKRRLPVSDEIIGLDTAKTLLRMTYDAMSETDEVDRATPLTRAREIALSLIESVISKKGTPLPSPKHFPPHSWRATVERNLRLEKTESSARLLRKLSHTRSENFDSNRAYFSGDDMRTVDWRSSARSERLLVRTYNETRKTLAEGYYVVLNLADFISPPQFAFRGRKNLEWTMEELTPNRPAMLSAFGFLHSLILEGRPVTVTAYAFGSAVWSTHHLRGGRDTLAELKNTWNQFEGNVYELNLLHADTQTSPYAYSKLVSLMSVDERRDLRDQLSPTTLLLYLHGNATVAYPLDPLIKELAFEGRAARVNVEV